MSPNITKANASKSQRARFLAPVLLVNGGAIIGQCLWAWDHVVPKALHQGAGIVPATVIMLAFACALESIGIYLSAEADEAAKANLASGALRLGSYFVGLVIGAINYAHFAGPNMSPTVLAVTLLILSALSPVMWAIRSRRVNRARLVELGLVEPRGLKLSLGRKIWHPVLSFHLLRWSAWEGVQDVGEAVEAWNQAGRPLSSGKAGEAPVSVVVEARAILAEAEQAREAAKAILASVEARAITPPRGPRPGGAKAPKAIEAAKAEAEAPADELAAARQRREQEPPAVGAIEAEASRLGRAPNRAEVKALLRVGSAKADEALRAWRESGALVFAEAGR